MTDLPLPRDEVDAIIDSWAGERPDLDATSMHIFSRVSRLARHFDLARRKAFSAHDLDPWEFDVLSSLRRAGDPYQLTPGDLLTEALVSSGTMTNRINRLVGRDLVVRVPSGVDRRVVYVRLTERGREMVDGALVTLLEAEDAILAAEDAATCEQMRDFLRRLLLPFDSA